jgi:WXG100 family type VII secretion target
MSRLRIDLERLDRLVEQMRHVQEELRSAHHDVETRVRQAHLTWSGPAAAAQAAAERRWALGAAEVQEALAALHSIAATAHANYAAAAHANRRMWAP